VREKVGKRTRWGKSGENNNRRRQGVTKRDACVRERARRSPSGLRIDEQSLTIEVGRKGKSLGNRREPAIQIGTVKGRTLAGSDISCMPERAYAQTGSAPGVGAMGGGGHSRPVRKTVGRRPGANVQGPRRGDGRICVSSRRSDRDQECHDEKHTRHEKFQMAQLSQKKLDDGTGRTPGVIPQALTRREGQCCGHFRTTFPPHRPEM
jgi:hypothetical protein